MAKYLRWVVVFLIACVLSAAGLYMYGGKSAPGVRPAQETAADAAGGEKQAGGGESAVQRVMTATEAVSDKTAVATAVPAQRVAQTNGPSGDRRRGRGLQERLEKLKETDPEQYKAIMAKRDAARQKTQNAFAERAAYLLSIDTTKMTPEELANYEKMTQVLNHMWGLSERMQGDLSPEERREVRELLRLDTQTLDPLLLAQRDKEWMSVGLQAGYSQEDARALADYMNKVIELTSMRNAFQGVRGDQNAGEQRQNSAQTSIADKIAYFSAMDTKAMTAEELQNHDKLLQALDAVKQANQLMSKEMSADERRTAFDGMRSAMRALDPLLAAQRDAEWYKTGVQLGYNQTDAQAFVTYMNSVTDLTSLRTVFRNMRSGIPPSGGTGGQGAGTAAGSGAGPAGVTIKQ